MTEQKYPADIIETVAKALFAGYGSNGYHLDAHYRIEAVKVLDALGLTVTEEWATLHPSGAALPAGSWAGARTRSTALGQPILHRTVLHAETPWVEVVSDGTE